MSVWGIVVAGGSGTRFGTLKQLEPFGGQRVIDHAVGVLRAGAGDGLGGIVVVVPADLIGRVDLPGDVVVAGGADRAASVRSGLAAVPDGVERVLVHDGARPLTPPEVVRRVLDGLDTSPATVPVVPVTDSLRSIRGGSVDRAAFVAVQTPQGFHRSVLERAHRSMDDASAATDDASMVDAIGEEVAHVSGDVSNLKITTPGDLVVAEALLRSGASSSDDTDSSRT